MALNAPTLIATIEGKLTAEGFDLNYAGSKTKKFIDIIITEVIKHITTQGTVTVTVTSVSGVTTGPGVSGPGTGTGIIS